MQSLGRTRPNKLCSFALGWEEEDFIRSFGSREAVKPEVLGHWIQANKNDYQDRFNIEGMEETDYNFPKGGSSHNNGKNATEISWISYPHFDYIL